MMQHYDSVDYELLSKQLVALMSAESDALANSANFTGLLYNAISDINWLGIYVLRGNELVLGPFQGKPACVRLPLGRGVCGNAAKNQKTLRIEDVREFDGHIACDSASRSEIVVPLISSGALLGVLDIDSPGIGRFSEADQSGIEKLCTTFVEQLGLREMDRSEFI
jgi:L-methionine (R)-S-oxide reductase